MKRFIFTATLTLTPAAGWAQATTPARDTSQDIVIADRIAPIIVVGTKVAQYPENIGQSITEISAQTLEAHQTPILADILATAPGITVARNGGVGGTTSLFIRGASSDHTLVVVDGVAINDPSSPGGAYDFGNLLSGGISRVEILRGADSVPWGSAAIGGVINITTLPPASRFSLGASAEGGSYGTSNINGHISGGNDTVQASLGGGWLHTSGISAFAASEGGKEADGFDQHYLNGRVNVFVTNTISLDLRGRYARGNAQIDGYNTPTFTFGDDAEYTIMREASGYAGLHANFGALKNTLSFSITDIQRNTFDPTQAPAFEFGYKGQVQRIEYQGDARLVDYDTVRLAFGASHETSRLFSAADSFGDPAFTRRTGVESVYGQLITNALAGLTLTGGARYDNHRAYGGHISFAANGAYRLGDHTILRASFAQGYKAPTLYEFYAPFYGSAALKPETANSYDGGVEHSLFESKLKLHATYFHRDTDNLIVGDASTFIYGNIAHARADGVELEAAVHPLAVLNISANYTHTRSVDALTGKQLQRRPEDIGNFTVDWNAARFTLGGTLHINGPSYDDAANAVRLGGYVLLTVRGSVPLTSHLEAFARVENALDSQYQVVAHYGTLGRTGYAGIRVKI